MPTLTPENLKGAGITAGSFNGTKTFTFTYPSSTLTTTDDFPAYFTIEQEQDSANNIKRNSDGSMPETAVDYTEGVFDAFGGIPESGIVQNKYKFSIVVPRGTNTVRFTPVDTSRGGLLRYRGTGNFSLSF
jgi:hypothetical protein